MEPVVLTLALESLGPQQLAVNTPLKLSYTLSLTNLEAARSAKPDENWKIIEVPCCTDPTNDLFNDIQDARVGRERLVDFVKFDSVPMWQFLPSFLWPHFFRVVQVIDTVQRVVEQTKPSQILVIRGNDAWDTHWTGGTRAVADACGVPVICIEPRDVPKDSRVRTVLKAIARRFGYHPMWLYDLQDRRFRAQLRRVSLEGSGRTKDRTASNAASEETLVFATVARNWLSIPGGGSTRKYDEQFFPILPSLRELGYSRFIGIDCPYNDRVTPLSALKERIGQPETGFTWRSFFSYGTPKKWRSTHRKAQRVFRQQWSVMKDDPEFSRTFRYRGISLLPGLENELHNAFNRLLPDCAQMLAIARISLMEERPRAVVATYETGPYQRALLIEAERLGIPTIGLMHGMVFKNHYDYMHKGLSSKGSLEPGFAIADRFCVWGEFWKRNLTEVGHYPAENVTVTGNWRHAERDEKALAQGACTLRDRVCGDDRDKVILLLSGGDCVVDFLEKCCSSLSDLSNCKILVKLHPVDERLEILATLDRLCARGACTRIHDLFTGLTAADIIVSQASTAISEAVVFDRAVVWANFSKRLGWEDYLAHEAVLYAESESELRTRVSDGLYDTDVAKKLEQARRRMAEDYFDPGANAPSEVAATIHSRVLNTHLDIGIAKPQSP